MKRLFNKHIDIREKPKNFKAEDTLLFSHEFSKPINETTLLTLKDADIFRNLIFSIRKFRFYSDYSLLNKISAKQKVKMLFSLLPCKKIKKGIWITDDLSINYFHWFTEALPRLLATEHFLSRHLVLLPELYEKKSYVVQSLEFLNFPIKYFDPTKRVHIKELLLPSHTATTGNYNKEIINRVRNKFLISNQPTGNKRIYISREKAAKRKIINESEVTRLLKSYNFEVHFFEDYSFYKQLELAQQATHLIGLHGAGLTNMLFMHEKGKILELRNEGDDHNNCYYSLASDLGHDYYYIISKGDNPDTFDANLMIDVSTLETVLKQMMLGE